MSKGRKRFPVGPVKQIDLKRSSVNQKPVRLKRSFLMILWVLRSGRGAWLLCCHIAFLTRLQSESDRDCNHLKAPLGCVLTHLGTPTLACGCWLLLEAQQGCDQKAFLAWLSQGRKAVPDGGLLPRASIPREESRSGTACSDPA